MSLQIMFMSMLVALVLLVPIATKWQIQFKRSLPGALVIGLIAGALTNAAAIYLKGIGIMGQVSMEAVLVTGFAVTSAAYMFYRDPERVVPQQSGTIVSPADGSVIYVKRIRQGKVPLSTKRGRRFRLEELTQTNLLEDGGYLIGIGMNLLNVHVNRAPIMGKVEMINHVKGEFWSLKRPEAVLANERLTTVLNDGNFKVAVVQIASRLVRRIEPYLVEGQSVEKGQRIGMIKFGSQVDLVVPEIGRTSIKVKPGDEVVAGESVLVELTDNLIAAKSKAGNSKNHPVHG